MLNHNLAAKRTMTATFSYSTAYVRELTPICSGSITAMALVRREEMREDGGEDKNDVKLI